jgi:hypothetical protein
MQPTPSNNQTQQQEWYPAVLSDPLYTGITGGIAGAILAGLVVGLIMSRRNKKKQEELRAEAMKERTQLTQRLESTEKKAVKLESHLRRRNERMGQITNTLEHTFSLQEGANEAGQQQMATGDLFADALLHRHDEVVTRIVERWLDAKRERADHESQLHRLSDDLKKQRAAIDELNKTMTAQQANIADLEKDLVEARKSTMEKTLERAQQLPYEIKERIDERLVNPVRERIHETTEKVQQIPRQAKRNIDDRVLNPAKKQVHDLKEQAHELSKMVQELPHQAKVTLDERLVNPARTQVYQVSNKLSKAPHELKERLDRQVIHPVQNQIHHAAEMVQAFPHQAKVRFDEVAIRPATAQIKRIKEITILQSQQAIDSFNNRLIQPVMAGAATLSAKVKRSPKPVQEKATEQTGTEQQAKATNTFTQQMSDLMSSSPAPAPAEQH